MNSFKAYVFLFDAELMYFLVKKTTFVAFDIDQKVRFCKTNKAQYPANIGLWIISLIFYAEKELPQPHVLEALGLLKVNPRASRPFLKSTSIPARYKPCALFIKTLIPAILYSLSFFFLVET